MCQEADYLEIGMHLRGDPEWVVDHLFGLEGKSAVIYKKIKPLQDNRQGHHYVVCYQGRAGDSKASEVYKDVCFFDDPQRPSWSLVKQIADVMINLCTKENAGLSFTGYGCENKSSGSKAGNKLSIDSGAALHRTSSWH